MHAAGHGRHSGDLEGGGTWGLDEGGAEWVVCRLQTLSIASSLEIAGIAQTLHDSESAANIDGNKGTGLESSRTVIHFLLLILVLLGVALYFTTSVERTRIFRVILAALRNVKDAVALEGLQCDPFFDALRARTPRVVAAPALIALSATISFSPSTAGT